jgi:hypothetical protein
MIRRICLTSSSLLRRLFDGGVNISIGRRIGVCKDELFGSADVLWMGEVCKVLGDFCRFPGVWTGYPFTVETRATRDLHISNGWTYGFLLLVSLVAWCNIPACLVKRDFVSKTSSTAQPPFRNRILMN